MSTAADTCHGPDEFMSGILGNSSFSREQDRPTLVDMDDRSVVVLGYDGVELIDVACVTSGFEMANRMGATPPYAITVATLIGRPLRTDSGLELRAQRRLDAITTPFDTLVVSGGLGHEDAADNNRLVGHLRRVAPLARRVAAVCTGATVLAAAGLLDGRRATTHWHYADRLARRYPAVTVDPTPIYIRDGSIATSGGVTSALDLTLAFIEEDNGADLARRVAMGMVTYLQRPGNQAQMSMYTTLPSTDQPHARRVLDHILTHLSDDLSTSSLATVTGVSERHLARLCTEHLGRTPAKLVRDIRLDAAARLLAETSRSATAIAHDCGFASAEALRQSFVARFGTAPTRFRTTHRVATH
ncbi:DJ-1/PfpI family protein [Gordonia sp. CPCC 206044]|uniref:GlxA family transcriptional regulator n=1 Tax=Gordonia sp. CPCC 206044 TaxID=3140793 RepID=UPI003AF33130